MKKNVLATVYWIWRKIGGLITFLILFIGFWLAESYYQTISSSLVIALLIQILFVGLAAIFLFYYEKGEKKRHDSGWGSLINIINGKL
jgi:amino acid transporter